MSLFAAWAWLVLGTYVIVLVLYSWRGASSSRRDILQVSDHLATVVQGARWQTLSGLLLISSSVMWGTVGAVVAYGAWGMLQDLQTTIWSPMGTALLCELILALLFVARCVWIGFGRWGVTMDGSARTVSTWWGIIAPFTRKSFSINDFSAVSVRKVGRRGRRFQVRLEHPQRPILVDRSVCRDPEDARQLAAEMAAVAKLEVQDFTQK